MIVDSGQFYLYRHIRLDSNQVFYIGIGKKRNVGYFKTYKSEFERAFSMGNHTKHWTNIVKKAGYKVEILYESNSLD